MRQILEHRGRILPGQHAEHDDLVLEAQRRQRFGDFAGVPVAEHVAKPAVVAAAQRGGELLRRLRHCSDGRECLVTFWAVKLVFHLLQGCSDNIVMMDVGANALGRVEP